MPNKLIDLTAKKINQLTVVRRVENKGIKTMWLCVCDCGNELIVAANHLNCNTCKTISCKDCCSKRKVKHRMCGSTEYSTWLGMKERCYIKTKRAYRWYGARGIIVCDRWLNSFENFYSDMGDKPSSRHSIERNNVNGNYEPLNCRWATKEEQARNMRSNHFITVDGVTKHMNEWAKIYRVNQSTISKRISNGMNPELAVITPSKYKKCLTTK